MGAWFKKKAVEVAKHRSDTDPYRADCCGVLWYVLVVKDKRFLTLCLHHFRAHALALFKDGWSVEKDLTHELSAR